MTRENAQALEDSNMMMQVQHRLGRLRDYSVPNAVMYFGVGATTANQEAHETLAKITNAFSDYEGGEFKLRMNGRQLSQLLYLLKESDTFLKQEEARVGGTQRFPMVYDKLAEFLQRRKVKVVEQSGAGGVVHDAVFKKRQHGIDNYEGDVDEATKVHLQRFTAYYAATPDGEIFRDEEVSAGTMDNGDVVPVSSRAMVMFDKKRTRDMLTDSRPALAVDFTPSIGQIVAAVAKVSPDDAPKVEALLKRNGAREIEVNWGDLQVHTQTPGAFGFDWPYDDRRALDEKTRNLIDNAWEKAQGMITKAGEVYDTPQELVKSFSNPKMQEKLMANVFSTGTQAGPTKPGTKPRDDKYPH